MAEDIKTGYKRLDYVVAQVQNNLKDYSTTNYQRILQFAINGYKELNYTILPTIKVDYFKLSDIYTIDFPDDYVDYVMIAMDIGGRLVTLSVNPKIPLSRKRNDCGEPIVDFTSNLNTDVGYLLPYTNGYFFASTYRNGQYVGERFAHGGGFNRYGYFRVDYEMKRFQFQNTIPNVEIVMEYKSTGIDCNGDALVPDDAVQAIVAYVHNEINFFDKRASTYDKEMGRKRYLEQFLMLRRKKFKFTMSEYLDAKYKNVHLGIKR